MPRPAPLASPRDPAPRVLAAEELASLAAAVDLARALLAPVSTRDSRPIDVPTGAALAAWEAHPLRPLAPTFLYEGGLARPPAKSGLERAFTPEDHWAGWTEPVRFDVQGARVGAWSFLFLFGGSTFVPAPGWRPRAPHRWSLWGVKHRSPRLVARRDLPFAETALLTAEAIGALLVEAERSAIDGAARAATASSGNHRL